MISVEEHPFHTIATDEFEPVQDYIDLDNLEESASSPYILIPKGPCAACEGINRVEK